MQILQSLDLKPFSRSSSSPSELARVWEREAGRAADILTRSAGALRSARREGAGGSSDDRGLSVLRNEVSRGVAAADPRNEQSRTLRALANGAGVSGNITQAERHSGDPRFNAPTPNYGGPAASVRGRTGNIERDGREVGRRSGEAQRFENEVRGKL